MTSALKDQSVKLKTLPAGAMLETALKVRLKTIVAPAAEQGGADNGHGLTR
jgi:hypothetical protein